MEEVKDSVPEAFPEAVDEIPPLKQSNKLPENERVRDVGNR